MQPVIYVPPLHSTSNRQVERFHDTLMEIGRELVMGQKSHDIAIVIALYNMSKHSVTNKMPIEIIFSTPGKFNQTI